MRRLPDVFVDISLGGIAVPRVFREAGYKVVTLHEQFGQRPVPDTEWMQWADDRDMVVLCKDQRIRRNPAEKYLLSRSQLRVVCLTSGQLRSSEQETLFRSHLGALERRWDDPERPWFVGLSPSGLTRLRIESPGNVDP
ncbi:hypothetical protein C8046_15570 [Serinibacter arcticus]|uniref:VapC45 PIN like domain-containing protein n=1 Tax=Serinibacter arcticus TaxID=1655435 RepID=A0A2U1ZY58_9MICO|nr:DUF5615 family PIN-like protein [Serinibacter arcticus]PWD51852.1 hypothetical protein C8046_15570 [Serinibacter arcticus]